MTFRIFNAKVINVRTVHTKSDICKHVKKYTFSVWNGSLWEMRDCRCVLRPAAVPIPMRPWPSLPLSLFSNFLFSFPPLSFSSPKRLPLSVLWVFMSSRIYSLSLSFVSSKFLLSSASHPLLSFLASSPLLSCILSYPFLPSSTLSPHNSLMSVKVRIMRGSISCAYAHTGMTLSCLVLMVSLASRQHLSF